MKIITAANHSYRNILDCSLRQTSAAGYSCDVYDIGGLGFGIPFKDAPQPTQRPGGAGFLGRCPYKPRIIQRAIENATGLVVWLDADAFAIRRFDEVDSQDYDIGVTMRRQGERGSGEFPLITGYLNAGVVFIRPNDASNRFVAEWIEETSNEPSQSDQAALNRLVMKATSLTIYNRVFVLNGVRIKVFKTDDYNFYYYPEEPGRNTKILHLKTGTRSDEAWRNWSVRKWS